MDRHPLESIDEVKSLAERFAKNPKIAGLSTGHHNEPWVLAHSLADIAEASQAYLEALPSILDPKLQGDDLVRELIVLTVELQHMLYHLQDPEFLRTLFAPLTTEWDRARAERS